MASKSSASSNQSPKVSYPVPTIYKPQIKSNQNSQTPTTANKPSFPLPRTHSERMEFRTPNSPSNPFINSPSNLFVNSGGFNGSSQKTMAERQFGIMEQARKVTCSEDNERVNNREIVRTNDFQKVGMYGNIAFGSMTAAAGAKAAMGAKMAAGAAYGFGFGAGILVGVMVKSVEYRHGELVKDPGVHVEGTANPPDYGGANTVYHRYNEWGELISKTFYNETGMAYYTMVMEVTVSPELLISWQESAIAARDAALADAATLSSNNRQDITTIVAGYNKVTGQVAVGINISSINHGTLCAEDLVVAQLGGIAQINNIIMTPAVRPRTGQIIPVCKRCQTKYPKSSFMPGTPFL